MLISILIPIVIVVIAVAVIFGRWAQARGLLSASAGENAAVPEAAKAAEPTTSVPALPAVAVTVA